MSLVETDEFLKGMRKRGFVLNYNKSRWLGPCGFDFGHLAHSQETLDMLDRELAERRNNASLVTEKHE